MAHTPIKVITAISTVMDTMHNMKGNGFSHVCSRSSQPKSCVTTKLKLSPESSRSMAGSTRAVLGETKEVMHAPQK